MRRVMIGCCLISLRAALVGGGWYDSTNAGVFALDLSSDPSITSYTVGLLAAKQKRFSLNLEKHFLPSVLIAFGDIILAASGYRSAKYINRLAGIIKYPCQPTGVVS